MLIIGHRGAAGRVPENTIASLRYALEAGADGVEFDLRRHEDRLIVLHDATLDRTTNGCGEHRALSLTALRDLEAGDGSPIPFLEEALAAVRGCGLVNLEIKDPAIARAVVDATAAFIGTDPQWDGRVLYSSFDADATATLARLKGRQKLGVLFEQDFDDALRRAAELDAWSIHLEYAMVNADAVQRAQASGLKVLVYTVNREDDIRRCADLGVDGVFSDFPDRAREVVGTDLTCGET